MGSQRHRRRPQAGADALRRHLPDLEQQERSPGTSPTSMRNVDAECRSRSRWPTSSADAEMQEDAGMSTGSMRRAQLVTPFGVGAMSVLVNGTSVITAGLDHWYPREQHQTSRWRSTGQRLAARSPAARQGVPAAAGLPDRGRRRPAQRPADGASAALPALASACTASGSRRCRSASSSRWAARTRARRTRPYKPADVPGAVRRNLRAGHLDDFPFEKWVAPVAQPDVQRHAPADLDGGGGLEGQVVRCGFDAKGQRRRAPGCGASPIAAGHHTAGRRDEDRRRTTVLTSSSQAGQIRTSAPARVRGCMKQAAPAISRCAVPACGGQRLLPEGRVVDLPAAEDRRCQRRAARPDAAPRRRARS